MEQNRKATMNSIPPSPSLIILPRDFSAGEKMTSASFRIIATYPSACQGHSALESALDKEYEPALGLGNLCPPSSAIVNYKFTLLVADSFHSTECRYSLTGFIAHPGAAEQEGGASSPGTTAQCHLPPKSTFHGFIF